MSLINEALKKAQKQRETTPGLPPPPAQPPLVASSSNPSDEPRRARPAAPSRNGVLIAGACAIVAVSVAATVYLLRSPAAVPPAAALPVSTPVLQGAAPGSVPNPRAVVPAETPRPTAAPTPTAVPTIAPAPVVSAAPTAAPEVRPAATEPSPVKNTLRIQAMIDKFRISGIRLSDTESRVILNDHLFRANDVVESSLGLRLVRIEAHALSFVDAEGNQYQKRF